MKKLIWALPALALAIPPALLADTILPGTQIQVRPDTTIEVSRWDRGRIYPGRVARDVYARDGDLAVPAGSYAELIVRENGPDQFTLDLESITVNGQRYVMDTAGPQYNMPENTYNNGSGIVGAIIGAIAGANGENVETQGAELHVPRGALLTFQLREPLHMVGYEDPGYTNRGYHYHRDRDWYR